MVHYFERLDAFIEKWQSKRRTFQISSSSSSPAAVQKQPAVEQRTTDQAIMMKVNRVAPEAIATAIANSDESEARLTTIQENDEATSESPAVAIVVQKKRQTVVAHEQLISCPNLLYASICLLLLIAISADLSCLSIEKTNTLRGHHVVAASEIQQMKPPANNPTSAKITPTSVLTTLTLGLIQQLAANRGRERWTHVPSPMPGGVRDHPTRWPARNGGRRRISQAISRIGNRIGARNTIRVHNAFRDFAWRLLSSLSMPTPVIYEIRRQHLYSPEDDQINDQLHAKNTSRTIRSKRYLDLLGFVNGADPSESSSHILSRSGGEQDQG